MLQAAFDTQFGGLPTRGADIAVMYMRLIALWTLQQGLSLSEIFIDAVSAFQSVVRALAIGDFNRDEAVAKIFEALNMSPDDFRAFAAELQSCALEDALVPEEMRVLVSESHHQTWFSLEGLEEITETKAGTMAGDPSAMQSIIF